MGRFAYKAIAAGPAPSGGVVSRSSDRRAKGLIAGEQEADDESALRRSLREKGLVAIEVRPVGRGVLARLGASAPLRTRDEARSGAATAASRRVRARDRAWFFQTLRRLLEGQTPVEESLATMAELAPGPAARSACERVRAALRGGSTLADAAQRVAGLAEPHHIALLRVGHASGSLTKVVGLIDAALRRRRELHRLVAGRLTYPAIVVVVAILVVWFMSAYIVPRFAETLASAGASLPLATRFTLGAADAMLWLAPIAVLAAIGLAVAWRRGALPVEFRQAVEAQTLRVPVLRDLVWTGHAALTCDVLATTVAGGGDLLEAMDLAGGSLRSPLLRSRLKRARTMVREGRDVGEALHEAAVFPPLVSAIVRTGVRSGDLPGGLRRAADAAAERQRDLTERLVTLLEPAGILLIATVVGWVIYSVVAGMLSIYDLGGI